MANEVTPHHNAPITDPYEQLGDEVSSRAHIYGNLLRFTKHGEYKTGQDQEEVPEGTRMLVYMPSLKKGWVKWHEGQPVRHIIGLVAEGYSPPARETLGDMDEDDWGELNGRAIDPWQYSFYVCMLDEEGELHTFVTSSKGGQSAIGEISKVYGRRRRMKPDELPIIELNARSYNHKDYGETFAPQFKVTGWAKTPQDFDELKNVLGNGGDAEAIEDKTEVFTTKTKAKKPAEKVKAPPPPQRGKKKSSTSKGVRF
jgi:hypothetical protein